MRVLIVADELFASRERSLLTRLEVGLADEGIIVAYAVPRKIIDDTPGSAADLSGVFSKVVPYSPAPFALARRFAAADLERGLSELPGDFETIDVVHVFGGAAWDLAATVADHLEAPLAVEAWRAGLEDTARTLVSTSDRIDRTIFIASDPSIERELNHVAQPSSRNATALTPRTRCVPWGVLTPAEHRAATESPGTARPASVMLIGSGRDSDAWNAALQGCADAIRGGLDLLIFADALAARRSELWARARSLSLLDRLSLIEDLESRRDLMLHGDLVLLPESRGEQRSVVLQCMASELLVIAAADPHSSVLQDGRTCVAVSHRSKDSWASAISRLLSDPVAAKTLVESARFFVQMHRKASDHIRGVQAVYAELTSGNAIKFSK
ncbi:MAG: hypothetical protein NTV94_07895 [Planctomycetota bacterium]|nr:hypothetical protein [Planctomycetota bacterium]